MQVGQLGRFFSANSTFSVNLFYQNLTISLNWLTVYAWERGSIGKLAFYKGVFSADS